MPITTEVVSLNPVHDGVYSIQHYVIKFVSDLRHVGGFLQILRFPPAEVAAWVVESWKGVKKFCILNGFKKAEIYPYDDNTVDSDVESSDNDEPLSNIDTRITPDLAELFHSDSEDEDFDGFTDDH